MAERSFIEQGILGSGPAGPVDELVAIEKLPIGERNSRLLTLKEWLETQWEVLKQETLNPGWSFSAPFPDHCQNGYISKSSTSKGIWVSSDGILPGLISKITVTEEDVARHTTVFVGDVDGGLEGVTATVVNTFLVNENVRHEEQVVLRYQTGRGFEFTRSDRTTKVFPLSIG